LKVLVLAPPMEGFGGIQRYTATLVHALKELFEEKDVRLLPVHLRNNGRKQGSRLGGGVKAGFLGKVLRETAAWRPNLVVCAHVGLAPLGWLLRALWNHQYWVVAYGIEVWGKLPKWNHQALVRSDRLVAISAFTREQLIRRQGVLPERTCLLPPTLETEWLSRAVMCTAHPRQDRRPTLLTVSRLDETERYKGHDVVLRALLEVREKVPGVLYIAVGDGNDRPRLEKLACSLGLGNSVRFAGAVSFEKLMTYYRDCDVFLMPSNTVLDESPPKGEGFGIVFLEAMACGKPVVGPNFGAPSEFICHEKHGLLVNPEDSGDVARALITLLTSPNRAQEMGAAGRDWVQREYCYEQFCKRVRLLFRE
jgi:glycosyltransferase involved in cell wall biosynthesis